MSDPKPDAFTEVGNQVPLFKASAPGSIGPMVGGDIPHVDAAEARAFDTPENAPQVDNTTTNMPIGSALARRGGHSINLTDGPSGVLGQNPSPGIRR